MKFTIIMLHALCIIFHFVSYPVFHPDMMYYTWNISSNSKQFGGTWDCGELSRDICLEAESKGYECYMYHVRPQHWVSYVDGYVYDGTHNSTYLVVPDALAEVWDKDRAAFVWREDYETT